MSRVPEAYLEARAQEIRDAAMRVFVRRGVEGATMLEIARFFAGLARHDGARDRYRIRGVMGPDEYSTRYPGADVPGIDDNAYTNVMTVWLLLRARQQCREARVNTGSDAKQQPTPAGWERCGRAAHIIMPIPMGPWMS